MICPVGFHVAGKLRRALTRCQGLSFSAAVHFVPEYLSPAVRHERCFKPGCCVVFD
ncbi:hypothetical protein KPSA1_00713 [Pseudomonas syringae pv. actinidiae]|uniref:Uncharacterized protein n=1 Tax=Pseudomonas syringae pv. actinidiae TaxID=103796 RepID=A0A2V0Q4Q7_PSESF|nr:hypothetical protein KPSA1_00713 [Pseudomonas syringae pv. actinidiae]